MKPAVSRERLCREEGGFTLPEVLVAMVMMVTVLFALYSIFDMSIRVFSFGNNKVEAVENARIGLAKMEQEIRAAYPVDQTNSKDYLFFSATSASAANSSPATAPPQVMPGDKQITFGNDLDGNGKVQCPNTLGECEYITYKLNASSSTLLRNNTAIGSGSSSGGTPVVEFVDGAAGLDFSYLKSGGSPATTESEIERVRITLRIRVPGVQDGTQTLTTDVALRNRS